MKLIKAFIRTFMAEKVIEELKKIKARDITVVDVKALGDEVSHEGLEISAELGSTYTTMVKIEFVCRDEYVSKTKDAIMKAAKTGYKGDGIIAISPVEEAVSIRTREKLI
ncbi:MAG: P-II family nitrogen regulator [bacterium]